jgi:hypothetical protein
MLAKQRSSASDRGSRHHLHLPWVLGIATLMLLAACDVQDKLPTAPSELTSGIVIYEHANYQGASAHVTEDIGHLRDVKGPCERFEGGSGPADPGTTIHLWDDCLSSVRVAPGWRAVLYKHGDFGGDQFPVTQDIPDLTVVRGDCDKGGFNDCVTSIRLIRP